MTENNFPDKLLYYSKIGKYCIDVILKNTLGITDPARGFNDPLDCFFEVDHIELEKEEIIEHLSGIFINENYISKGQQIPDLSKDDQYTINNYRDELNRCTEEVLKQKLSEYSTIEIRKSFSKFLRIRSFSAQATDKTLNSVIFSHYGNSHKGLCYIFDRKKLIPKELMDLLVEVKYLPVPALIKYKATEEYTNEEFIQIAKEMIRIKHEDWKYENEWRMIIGLTSHSEKITNSWGFQPDALEGIVLGIKTSKEDEARIIELVYKRQPNVNIYKAERKYGSFSLEYEKNIIN